MKEYHGFQHPNSCYRDYVARAVEAHLEALDGFGTRGWSAKNGSFVRLSEMESAECLHDALVRFMTAIDKRNPIVIQLIMDYAPESLSTYRMLRRFFIRSAYDMFRAKRREVPMGIASAEDASNDSSGISPDRLEDLLNSYRQLHPLANPFDQLEASDTVAKLIAKAVSKRLLSETRQFILLATLQARDEDDIAQEMGLTKIQIQRHLYEIRQALKAAQDALEVEA